MLCMKWKLKEHHHETNLEELKNTGLNTQMDGEQI